MQLRNPRNQSAIACKIKAESLDRFTTPYCSITEPRIDWARFSLFQQHSFASVSQSLSYQKITFPETNFPISSQGIFENLSQLHEFLTACIAELCFMVLLNGDFSETMRSTNKLLVPVDSVLLQFFWLVKFWPLPFFICVNFTNNPCGIQELLCKHV